MPINTTAPAVPAPQICIDSSTSDATEYSLNNTTYTTQKTLTFTLPTNAVVLGWKIALNGKVGGSTNGQVKLLVAGFPISDKNGATQDDMILIPNGTSTYTAFESNFITRAVIAPTYYQGATMWTKSKNTTLTVNVQQRCSGAATSYFKDLIVSVIYLVPALITTDSEKFA
jgi:hypothetical protein